VYYKGSWIPFEDGIAEKFEFELPPKRKYYPNKVRRAKVGAAFPLISTMIVAVVVASFAVLTFRLFVQQANSFGGSIAGAALNAVTIIVMNILWKTVAKKLTMWENYRTESEFENNLIFKIFTFYFVNSYTSLFYIAFFKNSTNLFGRTNIQDSCKTYFSAPETVISNGCADEVTFQLVTILLVNMFIGQSQEVAIPWIVGKIKLYLANRNGEAVPKELPPWERDNKKNLFGGTLDEYSELVIQYGYLTIFAATFPLAPLLAVLNNMIEIRTDAFKLLTGCCRPHYRGAQNIGTWYSILELLGVVAVFTNCALIGLSFEVLFASVGGLSGNPKASFITLGIVVIMEHFIFILKFVISFLVPDYPGWIIKKLAFEEWLKQESFKAARRKTHRNTMWDSGNHGDDEVDDDNMMQPATPATTATPDPNNDVKLVVS
jgi:hypothetical protein